MSKIISITVLFLFLVIGAYHFEVPPMPQPLDPPRNPYTLNDGRAQPAIGDPSTWKIPLMLSPEGFMLAVALCMTEYYDGTPYVDDDCVQNYGY